MTAKLGSEDGKACYAKRKQTIEPVFGQLKEQQGAWRFVRGGMVACPAEWKLLCGRYNLLKLWRHTATGGCPCARDYSLARCHAGHRGSQLPRSQPTPAQCE
jgi:hypothetical protein